MAEVSYAVSTIGLVIPFALINPVLSGDGAGGPISNALAVTAATWVAHNGKRRPLTLSQSVSATFTYTISASDSRTPHIEEGYVEVTFGEHTFATNVFSVNCFQHF